MNTLHDLIVNVLPAGRVTLEITFGAWVISILLGAVLAVVRIQGRSLPRFAIGATVSLGRSVPPLVLLYLLYFGLPSAGVSMSAVFAAIIGLGIADAVYSAEYYRGAFSTISVEQWEASFSLGMSPRAGLRHVILPQIIPFVIPPVVNSFVNLTKAAVFASAIGAPELLFTGENYMANTGNVVGTAIFIMGLYLVVTVPLSRMARKLEDRIRVAHA